MYFLQLISVDFLVVLLVVHLVVVLVVVFSWLAFAVVVVVAVAAVLTVVSVVLLPDLGPMLTVTDLFFFWVFSFYFSGLDLCFET